LLPLTACRSCISAVISADCYCLAVRANCCQTLCATSSSLLTHRACCALPTRCTQLSPLLLLLLSTELGWLAGDVAHELVATGCRPAAVLFEAKPCSAQCCCCTKRASMAQFERLTWHSVASRWRVTCNASGSDVTEYVTAAAAAASVLCWQQWQCVSSAVYQQQLQQQQQQQQWQCASSCSSSSALL
jgi:hypothetical protein